MSVLAVIPARLGATRLPRKPLRLLGGLPLIVRVAQKVEEMGVADLCVVATDSHEILDVCSQAGIRAELTSNTHPSGTDRVAEVAAKPAFSDFNIIVNVQGDEPFISKETVVGAVSLVSGSNFSIGTAAFQAAPEILAQSDKVKVICSENGRALYFSRAPIPSLREPEDESDRNALIRQHIGIYAYTAEALARWVSLPVHPLEKIERLEQLRPLAHGIDIGVSTVPPAEGGIDTEEDLRKANQFMASGALTYKSVAATPVTTTPFLQDPS